MAESVIHAPITKTEWYLNGVIIRQIRGNVVTIVFGGGFTLPSNQETHILTFTDYNPKLQTYAVVSMGGSSNRFALLALNSNGELRGYNYSGSVGNYIIGSMTYCI